MLNVTCTEYTLLSISSPNIPQLLYFCCFKSLYAVSDYDAKSDVSTLECLSYLSMGIVIIHLL